MAVKLRLKRVGRHKLAIYRIVAADSRAPRDGKFIEIIGTYDPNTNPATVKVEEEKALAWLGKGAMPTDTVRNIFQKQGIMQKHHIAKVAAKKSKGE